VRPLLFDLVIPKDRKTNWVLLIGVVDRLLRAGSRGHRTDAFSGVFVLNPYSAYFKVLVYLSR
jgi:hypothetical protein